MNPDLGVIMHDPFSDYFKPRYLGARRYLDDTAPPPVPPQHKLKRWDVPGAPNGIWLPPDIEVHTLLTPVGPNRSGRRLTPDGTVFHETGNRGVGTDAWMHARWQRDGTPGHPDGKIGVHAYLHDRTVVITIPFNEQGVHSGDSRNTTKIGIETCVNADRNAELTERTAMYLHATILRDVIQPATSALKSMWSHTTTGCPAIINHSGRWKQVETQTDAYIRDGQTGAPPPPTPTYAKPSLVPFEWTGEDIVHKGTTFLAIHRVFRAAKDGVKAYKYADTGSGEVRRPLPKGEGTEIRWAVFSKDEWWLISKHGSRFRAAEMSPQINLTSMAAVAEPVGPMMVSP